MANERYARIVGEVVEEIMTPVPGFTMDQCVPKEVFDTLIDVTDMSSVKVGWVYRNGGFNAPEAIQLSLEQVTKQKIKQLFDEYSYQFKMLTTKYPEEEREGWSLQREEALHVLSGGTDAPMLEEIIRKRGFGESLEEFAKNVLAHSLEFKRMYGLLTGEQQRIYNEIEGLQTREDAVAYEIQWNLS